MASWVFGEMIEELKAQRLVDMEMEASIRFTLASIYEVMASTVCAGATSRILGKTSLHAGTDNMIKVANWAVHILNDRHRRKKERGEELLLPLTLGTKHIRWTAARCLGRGRGRDAPTDTITVDGKSAPRGN
jgi:hypothetical protein